ncbi:hypothetical protein BC828DRAFT_391216 [Blastocladiella britannica]|nr:hypothetical protein BC828DRAFT_391216 [Blastocladiella britannica]
MKAISSRQATQPTKVMTRPTSFTRSLITLVAFSIVVTAVSYTVTLKIQSFGNGTMHPTTYGYITSYRAVSWMVRAVMMQTVFALVFSVGIFHRIPPAVKLMQKLKVHRRPSEATSMSIAGVNHRWETVNWFGLLWVAVFGCMSVVRFILGLLLDPQNTSLADCIALNSAWETASYSYICILGPILFRIRLSRMDPTSATFRTMPYMFFLVWIPLASWIAYLLGLPGGLLGTLLATVAALLLEFIGACLAVSRQTAHLWIQHFDAVFSYFGTIWIFRALTEILPSFLTAFGSWPPVRAFSTTLMRLLMGLTVLGIETFSRYIFGTGDMWLSFIHRVMEELSVIYLQIRATDSVESVVLFSVVNLLVVALRDSAIVNDIYFAKTHWVTVKDLYYALPVRDWPVSPHDAGLGLLEVSGQETAASLPSPAIATASNQAKVAAAYAPCNSLCDWIQEVRDQVTRSEHCMVTRAIGIAAMSTQAALDAMVTTPLKEEWTLRVALILGVAISGAMGQLVARFFLMRKVSIANAGVLSAWQSHHQQHPVAHKEAEAAAQKRHFLHKYKVRTWTSDYRHSTSGRLVLIGLTYSLMTSFQPS